MTTSTGPAGEKSYAFSPHTGRVKKNEKAATLLGERRRSASIRDLDYLVLRRRVEIIGEWISKLPNQPLSVADLGGRIQPYRSLFPQLAEYVALDLQLEGLVDVVADASSIPLKDEVCDVVFSTQMLSYVARPERVIEETLRILKPGGTLILSAPSFFPQHHDELWRFTALGLERLLSGFGEVEIVPECFSAAGIARSLNNLLHSGIHNYRAIRVAEMSSIPIINAIGRVLDKLRPNDQRCTGNYCARAVKRRAGQSPGLISE